MPSVIISHAAQFFFVFTGPTWLSSACVSLSLILYFTTSPFICWLWVCSVLIRWRISLLMGPERKKWNRKEKQPWRTEVSVVLPLSAELVREHKDIYFHSMLKLPACSLAARVCSNSMRNISYSFLTWASVSSSWNTSVRTFLCRATSSFCTQWRWEWKKDKNLINHNTHTQQHRQKLTSMCSSCRSLAVLVVLSRARVSSNWALRIRDSL